MKLEKSCGGLVVNEGKVALVYQAGPETWSFPKGHRESHETPIEAAYREVLEETGLTNLTLLRPLGSYQRPIIGRPGILKELTYFLFISDDDEIIPERSINVGQWVDVNNVTDFLIYQHDIDFYRRIEDIVRSV
ncbi:TPA: NUDIX domain-containing protein [Candidatus Woesearchaeota archaeon]|nr:hypothetical protein [archaeon]HIJ11046.1 NUDIX domain-containing protein [Candidatus Woesearchaeota archaeon]|tara:strand:- start:149 stop:550 length:402 start_codon:yes stop_codon:yes gene_type:complete